MKYRKPWVDGEWAKWLRELRGKSGVYVVREVPFLGLGGAVLYVGEAHGEQKRGDLYKTITRHMQEWNGPTAGRQWYRDEVQIAVRVLPPERAKKEQERYIRALKPRMNALLLGDAKADDWTPF